MDCGGSWVETSCRTLTFLIASRDSGRGAIMIAATFLELKFKPYCEKNKKRRNSCYC